MRRLKFVKSYLDRHNRPRHYFKRKGSPSTALPGLIGSKEFMAAYGKALAGAPVVVGAKRTAPDSFSAMIVGYMNSAHFSKLAPVSQAQYRERLEWIRRDLGEQSIAALKRPHIIKLLDGMRATPVAAQDWSR